MYHDATLRCGAHPAPRLPFGSTQRRVPREVTSRTFTGPSGEAPGVRGDSAMVTLDTWCETPFGWSEPCRVRVAFQDQGRFRRLSLQRADSAAGSPSARVVLRDSLSAGRFTYLVDTFLERTAEAVISRS